MTEPMENKTVAENFFDDIDDTDITLFEGVGLSQISQSLDTLNRPPSELDASNKGFRVRLARTEDEQSKAASFIRERYETRGYGVSQVQSDPNLFTFVASNAGHLVGTLSVRLDSDKRLSCDNLYREELDALRDRGIRLCEFTRLAVDNAGVISKLVLASLFHAAYLFAVRVRGCDSAVIEVNPRHVIYYKRALEFEAIGPERMNMQVQAPAVLMHVKFSKIAEGLSKFGGKPEFANQTRSLYPYGFSAADAEGIYRRLKEMR